MPVSSIVAYECLPPTALDRFKYHLTLEQLQEAVNWKQLVYSMIDEKNRLILEVKHNPNHVTARVSHTTPSSDSQRVMEMITPPPGAYRFTVVSENGQSKLSPLQQRLLMVARDFQVFNYLPSNLRPNMHAMFDFNTLAFTNYNNAILLAGDRKSFAPCLRIEEYEDSFFSTSLPLPPPLRLFNMGYIVKFVSAFTTNPRVISLLQCNDLLRKGQ